MMKAKTLAVESAIAGGSVAVLAGHEVIAGWHSDESVARSEALLPRIAEILERSGTRKDELMHVAVSRGPGSFTGIRIGVATAMGLSRAFGVPCVGVSLLKAIGETQERSANRVVVVPIGRGGYCWQEFKSIGSEPLSCPVESGKFDEMIRYLNHHAPVVVLAHSDAVQDLSAIQSDLGTRARIIDLGRDLAVAVGVASLSVNDGLEPFYARDTAASIGHGDPK